MGIGILVILVVSVYKGRYRLTNMFHKCKDKMFGKTLMRAMEKHILL